MQVYAFRHERHRLCRYHALLHKPVHFRRTQGRQWRIRHTQSLSSFPNIQILEALTSMFSIQSHLYGFLSHHLNQFHPP